MAKRARLDLVRAGGVATAVRLVAFVVALAAVATIPATLVAAGRGHLAPGPMVVTLIVAALAILVATRVARSVDPLRS